jgi:hypothetical protein
MKNDFKMLAIYFVFNPPPPKKNSAKALVSGDSSRIFGLEK